MALMTNKGSFRPTQKPEVGVLGWLFYGRMAERKDAIAFVREILG